MAEVLYLLSERPTFHPFSTNALLLYPLKTSENRGFSDVFRVYRSGTLVENELIISEFKRIS